MSWPAYMLMFIASAAAADEPLHILVLSSERPLLIRLDVRVNGVPYREAFDVAWQDYLSHLFRHADRDGNDGLNPEEAERVPAPHSVLHGSWHGDQFEYNFAFNFRVLDRNGDGNVTLEELKNYYRRYAGGAFVSNSAVANAQAVVANGLLFNRLDEDKDGKVSTDELATAASVLRALDANGDEMISAAELAGNRAPPNTPNQPPEASEPLQPLSLVFTPNQVPADLGNLLRARYGKKTLLANEAKLKAEDIGLDSNTFTRLDQNQDGALDATELARLAQSDPDWVITVRLGEPDSKAALEIVSTTDPAKARIAPDHIAELRTGPTLIQLLRNIGTLRIIPSNSQSYLSQFVVDEGKEPVTLDRKSVRGQPPLAASFDLIDRDGDGKLTEAEVRHYLDDVHARHIKVLACRPAIEVSSEGQGLFDLLDQDRDARLSVREIGNAAKAVARTELESPIARTASVRDFRIAIALGQASLSPFGGNLVRMPWSSDQSLDGAGPVWFRKMDRNRDGDLTPNEFLGTTDDFQKLDADGDGLISAAEAERAGSRSER